MAIGIILGCVLIIACACCAAGVIKSSNAASKVCFAGITIICTLAFVILPFSFRTVNAGELAVVKTLGKITGTRNAGTNFDLWITTSYQYYDTKVQNIEIATVTYSSDAQTMDVAMTLQYQVMADKVVDIATQYGTLEVLQGRIQSIVIEKTKAVLSSYKAMDIIANRSNISPEVEAAVKSAVDEDYFVNITAVVLTNIDFSDSFEKAVEDKMVAEQTKLKADYDNETKIAQAEADAAVKIKAADAEVEIAKAKAEALKITADAEAAANKLISESLTDQLLESKFYDKWEGKLPQVMGESSTILDIRDNK